MVFVAIMSKPKEAAGKYLLPFFTSVFPDNHKGIFSLHTKLIPMYPLTSIRSASKAIRLDRFELYGSTSLR